MTDLSCPLSAICARRQAEIADLRQQLSAAFDKIRDLELALHHERVSRTEKLIRDNQRLLEDIDFLKELTKKPL